MKLISLILLIFSTKLSAGVTRYSIEIEAEPKVVWDYLSDNSKAAEWSVYFDHISSMPGDEADGSVGSKRRCFRNADESGMSWDEVVLITRPYTFRRLKTFNVQNSGYFWEKEMVFWAEQIYERTDEGYTRLTFRGVTLEPQGVFYEIMNWLNSSKVEEVFKKNLENIKAAIEQGDDYNRPHPWEESL